MEETFRRRHPVRLPTHMTGRLSAGAICVALSILTLKNVAAFSFVQSQFGAKCAAHQRFFRGLETTTRGASGTLFATPETFEIKDWHDDDDKNDDESASLLLSKLSDDLRRLASLRPPLPSADFSAPTALISAGSSYTRLWTASTWKHHADPPHVRYFRHVRSWPLSTSARKILPAVLISSGYTLVTALVLRNVRMGQCQLGAALAKGASAAMAALGAPLALLLTLRANASLGRLNEARVLWGRLILRGRNLASLLRVYVWPLHPPTAIMAVRYLAVLGWSIKAFVRNETDGDDSHLRQVYEIMLGQEEAAWLLDVKTMRPPVALVLRLRQLVADVARRRPGDSFFVPHASMESCLDDLDAVMGGCERLFASPIPPTYSRHLSRIMCMYLILLPFALVFSTPSLGAVVASSTLVSYVLIGIDEIGMEIENPFQLLPLQQLCGALQTVVGEHLLLPDVAKLEDIQ